MHRHAPIAFLAIAGLAAPAAAQCPPAVPTGVTASDGTDCTDVFLNWPPVSGATTYTVWRNTSNNYGTATLAGVPGVSEFTDSPPTPGVIYYYWVTATHIPCFPGSGTSDPSVVTTGYRAQGPATPISVNATNDDCRTILVTWEMPTQPLGGAVDTFTIYRSLVNLYLTSSEVGTASSGVREFEDTTASPDTTYYYWVRAENECGTAASSSDWGLFSLASPSNDACSSAINLTTLPGTLGSTRCAAPDGDALCGNSASSSDVWYKFIAPASGLLRMDTCNAVTAYDTVLSIHSGCPGTDQNQIACNDDYCGYQSTVQVQAQAGVTYYIRVAGWNGQYGTFYLTKTFTPSTCYPNCDASTTPPILNVLDFNCFLNRFSSGNAYANCDGSTIAPVLNVLDFNCFLNRFAAGCP
jgi:hypothetical protein